MARFIVSSERTRGRERDESSRPRKVRPAGGFATRRGRAAGTQGRRSPGQDPRHDGQPDRRRPSRSAEPFIARFFTGLRRPKRKILGTELAGEVEAVGAAVTEFEVGDAGLRRQRLRRARGVRLHAGERPAGAQAGRHDLRGGRGGLRRSDAWHCACLRRADLRRGRSILVYGASGSVGTAAVQLAKYFGADVTAVCDTKNVELVSSLGADRGHRLHAGGFHEERRDLRRHLRRGRQALVQALQTLTEAGRDLQRNRPRVLWQVPLLALWTRWIGDKRVKLGIPRVHEGGCPLPQGADRGGELPGGHRPVATRWSRWSRRRSTSRRGRRPATSS